VQAAFRRLLARQRRSRRRLPNETPREWAARTAIPGLEPALAVLEEELWSARPPEGARVDDAVETFERAGR
jgi:hypothetical protein